MNRINEFQNKLHIRFNSDKLLEEALTHSSFTKIKNNERLEFFGDSVLKLIASEYLFIKYPNYDEGKLTKIRSKLVSDLNLYKCAKYINLGDYLLMSEGEKNTGGKEKSSNLANAFEAILGSIYLDQGLAVTTTFLVPILKYAEENFIQEVENFKSILQEIAHKNKEPLPVYTIIEESGPEHDKNFKIKVEIKLQNNQFSALGIGKTKKDAEQLAAKNCLQILK